MILCDYEKSHMSTATRCDLRGGGSVSHRTRIIALNLTQSCMSATITVHNFLGAYEGIRQGIWHLIIL